MFEGVSLHLWLDLTRSINYTFPNPQVDNAVLTPADIWTSKYYKNAGVHDSIWNSL